MSVLSIFGLLVFLVFFFRTRQAWQGALRLHVQQLSKSHSSDSLRTEEMPMICKPMTSKRVSTLRRAPGTLTPTRQLNEVPTAAQVW